MTDADDTSDKTVPEYLPGKWYIDPTHSQVTFTIRHGLVRVRCGFTDVRGVLTAGDRLEDSSVSAWIDPLSFTSGLPARDEKIRSKPSFLWADRYPTIGFESLALLPDYENQTAKLIGDLKLVGTAKRVTLDVTTTGIGYVGHYGLRSGFAATTRLDTRDFGIEVTGSPVNTPRDLGDDNAILGWTLDVEIAIEAVHESDPGSYGIAKGY